MTYKEDQKRDRFLLKCLKELCIKNPSIPIREAFQMVLLETARNFRQ